MGCRKLTYYQEPESSEENFVFFRGTPEKSDTDEKFCVNYYPFGLQHSTSWTRPTDLKNNFLFNAGSELNEETKNYETFYRQYDPALGRFLSLDIAASKYAGESPYSFAGNNPIFFNDPLGDDYEYTGPGSGQHWSDKYRNRYGNYFMMRSSAFESRYGQSVSDYRAGRETMRNWGSYVASLPGNSETRIIQRDDGSWGTITYVSGSGIIADGDQGSNIPIEVYKGTAPDELFVERDGWSSQQAGLDVPLGLWSIGSYAYGINENVRAISIAEKNLDMLNQLKNSARLNVGRPSATDRNLAKAITKNSKMLQGMKLGARRMVGVGTVIGIVDLANADPEDRASKAAWLAADTTMGVIGLTGWGAPIAGVYFAGRFAYGLYELATTDD